MRLSLLAFALTATVATHALADGVYVTESFGGTAIKGELGERMGSAFRIKASLGIRRGRWAVEGWLGGMIGPYVEGASNTQPPPSCGGEPCTAARTTGTGGGEVGTGHSHVNGLFTYGLDVKYLQPLASHVELYLRGSTSRGVLDGGDYTGNGLGLGAGIQFKGKVPAIGFLFWPLFFTDWGPKVTAAAYIDNGYEFYRLHRNHGGGPATLEAQLHHLTVGFAVGSDF